jgi:hypothetical protein
MPSSNPCEPRRIAERSCVHRRPGRCPRCRRGYVTLSPLAPCQIGAANLWSDTVSPLTLSVSLSAACRWLSAPPVSGRVLCRRVSAPPRRVAGLPIGCGSSRGGQVDLRGHVALEVGLHLGGPRGGSRARRWLRGRGRLPRGGRRTPGGTGAVAQAVDQQIHHALGMAGVLVGGQTQVAHRLQQVVGLDVGADLTGGRRGLEQRSEGGHEALLEVGGQRVEGVARCSYRASWAGFSPGGSCRPVPAAQPRLSQRHPGIGAGGVRTSPAGARSGHSRPWRSTSP